MIDKPAFISVIVTTYNGEKFLNQALLSVLAQTYRDFEVIVIDDGSVTDGVERICRGYGDKLTYVKQSNKGIGIARNQGIRHSRGDYLTLIDDDDIWLPQKLEKQVNLFSQLNSRGLKPGLVYTGLQYIEEGGKPVSTSLYKSSGNNYDKLVFLDFIGTSSTVMIPRSVLDDVGLFDEEIFSSQDFDLWVRIAQKYEVYSLDEILVQYRNRVKSVSRMVDQKVASTNRVVEKIILRGGITEDTKTRLLAHYHKVNASRYKNAAYQSLFVHEEPRMFRKYMRQGARIWRGCFDIKAAIYYILSFISPHACKKIRSLKVSDKPDLVVEVSKLRF